MLGPALGTLTADNDLLGDMLDHRKICGIMEIE